MMGEGRLETLLGSYTINYNEKVDFENFGQKLETVLGKTLAKARVARIANGGLSLYSLGDVERRAV
jgi:hypothetical protein